MTPRCIFVGAMLALADLVMAKPVTLGTENMSTIQIANLTRTIDRQMLAAFGCVGQSCLLADTSGSTGKEPKLQAEGASEADIKCIIQYNPPIGELQKLNNGKGLPMVEKQNTTIMSTLMSGLNSIWRPMVQLTGSTDKGTFDGTCTPNILIFAKGTLEPGLYGIFVGPPLTTGLPTGWSSFPVKYDPDIPGDYCLGLPGGMVAKDVINQAAAKCPESNLFVSGYSQGAMVVRNGLARAEDSAKAKVKGVVTFGDPFNGAPIKGYTGPIEIFCSTDDGVCTGNFELAAGHLAYGITSVSLGQKKLLELAASASKGKESAPSAAKGKGPLLK